MRVCVFASGSGGNCLLVSGQQGNILIDAGISMRRIQAGLQQAGLSMQDINGVLITHEHSDHISGLKMLAKHFKLPVFAPDRLAHELAALDKNIEAVIKPVSLKRQFNGSGFEITACHTPHDAIESVAYRLDGESSFALATDMGHVTDDVKAMLRGVDTALIESNYDEDMLRSGPYPYFLKKRISSDFGHLSNSNCALFAEELVKQGTNKLVLGHLSRENNRPEIALKTVGERLHGSDAALLCAPPQGFLDIKIGK
ncbi:MAG: MBL fold metallo-hydrolase [Oscillospiraceae bacterium]|nr:MBL fold metallo-hydrolase [Oscillospiraceae bacterium]